MFFCSMFAFIYMFILITSVWSICTFFFCFFSPHFIHQRGQRRVSKLVHKEFRGCKLSIVLNPQTPTTGFELWPATKEDQKIPLDYKRFGLFPIVVGVILFNFIFLEDVIQRDSCITPRGWFMLWTPSDSQDVLFYYCNTVSSTFFQTIEYYELVLSTYNRSRAPPL